MARTAREKSKSGIYHVLLRAKDRLFLDESDREYFDLLIGKYLGANAEGRILGRMLGGRRVHLVIDERGGSLGEILKPFCTSYARYFNRVHGTEGKLFDGRFKSEPIESSQMLASLLRYMYREVPQSYGSDGFSEKKIKLETAEKMLFMDDYERMSAEELCGVIKYIVGSDFERLDAEDRLSAFMQADEKGIIRIGLLKKALGISDSPQIRMKRAGSSKEQIPQKAEEKKPAKKELSVWLL